MKKLSTLLMQRDALLHQVRLANLAFAYTTLEKFTRRIARARLHGEVTLARAAPESGHHWPTLTALEGNQSVIEEHFSEEDLMDLADVLAFVTGDDTLDMTFHLEEVAEVFLAPLRADLAREGVAIDLSDLRTDAPR